MTSRHVAASANDNALVRMSKWLGGIRAVISGILDDAKQPDSVRTIAELCSVTVDRLAHILGQVRYDTTHDGRFVAQAMEIAAELADEWHSLQTHALYETPLTRYLSSKSAGIANVAKRNAREREKADRTTLNTFLAWQANPTRRDALADLGQADRLKKYLKVARRTARDARRLRSMLKDGRIK
jgi:hypothetical protein